MNLFCDWRWGFFADDGFGNLIPLKNEQRRLGLFYSVNYQDSEPI